MAVLIRRPIFTLGGFSRNPPNRSGRTVTDDAIRRCYYHLATHCRRSQIKRSGSRNQTQADRRQSCDSDFWCACKKEEAAPARTKGANPLWSDTLDCAISARRGVLPTNRPHAATEPHSRELAKARMSDHLRCRMGLSDRRRAPPLAPQNQRRTPECLALVPKITV
jgi:hypothetical protein